MNVDELFKLKIAALMHDPPHKPYLLARREPHEEEAKELIERVLGGEGREIGDRYLGDPRCRLADRLASTFDRWVLGVMMGERYAPGAFAHAKVKLKNVVSPWFEVEPGTLYDEGKYEGYASELQRCLNGAKSWRDKYLLLYLLYELAWIGRGLGVGPADTRTPTHTVFDHNYATAMMINWTSREGGVRGCLVGLDVAGVQGFIASSRKLRDAWVSSYVVSALMWYTLAEVIETLGPDVVLMPTLRANPFYLHWLKGKLKNVDPPDCLEELVFLSDEVREMYRRLGVPPYPVVPGRATLVLPPWREVEEALRGECGWGLRGYFVGRFKAGWQKLWDAVETYAKERASAEEGTGRVLWEFVQKAFEHYHSEWTGSGFDEVPPFELRVEVVEISGGSQEADMWRVYDAKYRELVARLGLAKYEKKAPSTRLGLYELTRKAFEGAGLGFPERSRRGFEYCTCCGRNPALVVLPRDEEEYGEKLGTVASSLKGLNEGERALALTRLKTVFSPGERLCPWCFLKRVLSLEPRLLNVLLLDVEDHRGFARGLVSDGRRVFGFPSTSHVASTGLYRKLLDLEKLEDVMSKVKVEMEGYPPLLPRFLELPENWVWMWDFMSRLWEDLKEAERELAKRGEGLELLLYALYSLDPEELWFSDERRGQWERLFRGAGLSEWLWRYYALLKADGDSVGDLLEGEPAAFLGPHGDGEAKEFLKRYIESSCEGGLRDFVRMVLRGADEPREERVVNACARMLEQELKIGAGEAARRVKRVVDGFMWLLRELRIPVSPTYHVAVSSALMRAALADVAVVAALDGFVVYAGGDDMLAFVPVDRALDVAYASRRAYGGFRLDRVSGSLLKRGVSFERGFLKLRNAYLPMLPGAGKSYCIYIAHYHYPLRLAISSASQLIEEAKEECELEYLDEHLRGCRVRKDVAVVAYSPRGAEESAPLPLSWRRPLAPGDSRSVASALLSSKALLSSVDERVGVEGVLSRGTLHRFVEEGVKESLLALARKALVNVGAARDAYELLDAMLLAVLKRGLRKGRKERELEEVYDRAFRALAGKGYARFGLLRRGEEECVVALNLADAARLLSSGMR